MSITRSHLRFVNLLALLHRGVLVLPDGRWYVGAVHGEPEQARALDAITAAMDGM